jgi:rod shape determining protein RodA
LKREREFNSGFDILLFLLTLAILAFGIVAIYSATYGNTGGTEYYMKQLIFAIAGVIMVIGISYIPPRYIAVTSYYMYGFGLLLLIAVLLFGKTINGNKSWFYVGGFGIQPSEFAKLATLLAVSHFLNHGDEKKDVNDIKVLIKTALFIAVPAVLIKLQHDTGTMIVFLSMMIPILWASGLNTFFLFGIITPVLSVILGFLNPIFFYVGLLIVIIALIFFKRNLFASIAVFAINLAAGMSVQFLFSRLAQYQQDRINAVFNPELDPLRSGYNVIQSKVAIGSGGLYGKGYLQGSQTQLKFIPEQWTDFIFCMIGEEFGYIGAMILITLYVMLILKVFFNGLNSKNSYMSLVTIGIGGLLLFHLSINVGMTIGVMPVIGIPLPMVSYGVSSLLSFLAMIGFALNTYRHRNTYV